MPSARASPGAWKGAGRAAVVRDQPGRGQRRSAPPAPEPAAAHGADRGRVRRRAPAQRGRGPIAFPPARARWNSTSPPSRLIEPHKALHRYRLEGFDPDWVEAGTAPRGLLHQHRARVAIASASRAATPTGCGIEAGDALELSLAPHFYQTWWFYALLGAGGAGTGASSSPHARGPAARSLRRHLRRAHPHGARAARFAAAGHGGGAVAPAGAAQTLRAGCGCRSRPGGQPTS